MDKIQNITRGYDTNADGAVRNRTVQGNRTLPIIKTFKDKNTCQRTGFIENQGE